MAHRICLSYGFPHDDDADLSLYKAREKTPPFDEGRVAELLRNCDVVTVRKITRLGERRLRRIAEAAGIALERKRFFFSR